MNQSQTVDLQVKLCLVLANSEPTVKRIPTAQTYKELQAQCALMMKNANIPGNLKTALSYKDSDGDKIDVSDDYELQMAYATALSADCKVKFYLEVPSFVPAPAPKVEEPVAPKVEEPVVVEQPVVAEKPVEVPVFVEEHLVHFVSEKPAEEQPIQINAELEEADSDEFAHHVHHGKKGKKGKGKKGKKGKHGGPGANMPRRAIKNLIRNELETAVPGLFDKLIKEQEAEEEPVEESKDEKPVVHNGIVCDGCGMDPIVGIRYKCAVRKDFDYCEKCEATMSSDYPFLKIRNAGGAPSMIITVLNEDKNGNQTGDQPDWKQMKDTWRQIREQYAPRHRQGKEWSEEECQQKAKFWKNMVGGFLSKMGMDKQDWGQIKNNWHQMKEEWKQNCNKQGWDKQDWCQMKQNWQQMKQEWKDKHQGEGCHGKFDWSKIKEQWKEKHGDNWENFDWRQAKKEWRQQNGGCGGGHKLRRAVLVERLEQEIQCMPGCVQLQEVQVMNQTNWPWKQGCYLGVASEVD